MEKSWFMICTMFFLPPCLNLMITDIHCSTQLSSRSVLPTRFSPFSDVFKKPCEVRSSVLIFKSLCLENRRTPNAKDQFVEYSQPRNRVKGLRKPYALVSGINQKSLQSIERVKFPPTAITRSLLSHSRVKKDVAPLPCPIMR